MKLYCTECLRVRDREKFPADHANLCSECRGNVEPAALKPREVEALAFVIDQLPGNR